MTFGHIRQHQIGVGDRKFQPADMLADVAVERPRRGGVAAGLEGIAVAGLGAAATSGPTARHRLPLGPG